MPTEPQEQEQQQQQDEGEFFDPDPIFSEPVIGDFDDEENDEGNDD